MPPLFTCARGLGSVNGRYDIQVAKEYQGMGLGTRLLKATEELGKGAAVQKCRLTVFKVGGSSQLMTVAQSQSLFAVCGSHGLRD